ncbi:MAG: glycosyltransferase family 4 protein [Anaerolineae bacterium]
MRIGIDARLVYYSQAGIGQYILRLTEGLAQLEQEDEFILLQSRKDRTVIVDQPNFKVKSLWTPSHHRLEQLALPVEIVPLGLDVLHSPDFIPPFRRNCKSVITIHDLAFLLYPHFLTKESARYYSQIDKAVRHTDHIIAVSESTKQDTIHLLGVSEKKITVIHEAANPIYHSIDNPKALERVRTKYQINRDFILFVSTIEPRKNLPTLLRAYRKLLDEYKMEVQLVVAGRKGWLFSEVFKLVKELRLTDGVLFLDRVPVEDLPLLYNAAQVLVHPSRYEGFGLPPLEAMACGTPTVVSNVSALPEVVGDASLLVESEDVEGFTVAIWRVLTDQDLRAELREKGLKRAKLFSWTKAARQTMTIYHRLGSES